MIATTKRALICGVIVLILGAAVMGAYHYMQSTAPRYSFIDKKGRKVIIEELSYFDGLDKTDGKIYKPSDDTTGNRPLLIFSHGLGVNADFGAVYCETAASLGWYAYACIGDADFQGLALSTHFDADTAFLCKLQRIVDNLL